MDFYQLHEWTAHKVERISRDLRWALRRKRLQRSVKQYLQKPYQLTKEQKKEAKAYWKQYTKHFSPYWHELFLQKSGKFDVRYVPDDIMFTEIEDYLNCYDASRGIDNKCNYELYFPEVKQPKTLFRRMQGVYRDANFRVISEEAAVTNCLNEGVAVLKIATDVGYGGGVKFWSLKADGEETLRRLLKQMHGDLIAQSIIKQHPVLENLHKESVSCIRVVTMVTKEGPEYVCGYFRMGQGSKKVDYDGGCVSSIKPDGSLYEIGFDNGTCNPITAHESGVKFSDYTVPCYEKVKQMALQLHQKVGSFRIISWDFSVSTEEEPILIEMNCMYGGIMYHQLGFGPLFGEKTDKFLNEVFGKEEEE